MNQQLTVIRGAPGSGKSTLAARLRADSLSQVPVTFVVEMDDFRMIDGKYIHYPDPVINERIATQCYKAVVEHLNIGHSVIVANTFLRNKHVEPYRKLARLIPVTYQELVCLGTFGSIHGVHPDVAAAMRRQLEL